jgi:hypothetical protein
VSLTVQSNEEGHAMKRKFTRPPWWFAPAVLAGMAATVFAVTGLAGALSAQ